MVVGTFLDRLSPEEQKKIEESKFEIHELALECGLLSPLQCYEVSCFTMDNIEELKEVISALALSHSYMGERVPILSLRRKHSS